MTTPANRGYHNSQQQSNHDAAQREAEALARGEQEFWDRAFCAALAGLCATTYKPGNPSATAEAHADAALTARRQRKGRDGA